MGCIPPQPPGGRLSKIRSPDLQTLCALSPMCMRAPENFSTTENLCLQAVSCPSGAYVNCYALERVGGDTAPGTPVRPELQFSLRGCTGGEQGGWFIKHPVAGSSYICPKYPGPAESNVSVCNAAGCCQALPMIRECRSNWTCKLARPWPVSLGLGTVALHMGRLT